MTNRDELETLLKVHIEKELAAGDSVNVDRLARKAAEISETFWRSYLSSRIYRFGDKLRTEAGNVGIATAAYAIVQEVGNRVGQLGSEI